MAIHGRTGQVVEIVRIGTIDDVKALDGRKVDEENGCWPLKEFFAATSAEYPPEEKRSGHPWHETGRVAHVPKWNT